ncbi:hypothetical protein SALBM217S_10289 [Streptomyces griseoloalbus]
MTTLPRPTTELSADEARRIALRAQGLLGAPDRRAGVRGVLRHLGAVQLDTISVLARSHELIPYARLGAVGRRTVDEAYWKQGDRPAHTFEYWSHAACILPVEEWPHFAFRRRAYRARPHWNHELPDGVYDQVVKQLRVEGPLTATELGGAKRTGEWWDWSGTKVAVERALMYGEVVCVERRGWKRVYDLAERAVPASLLAEEPTDEECLRRLVGLAGPRAGRGHPRGHRGLPPAEGRAGRRGVSFSATCFRNRSGTSVLRPLTTMSTQNSVPGSLRFAADVSPFAPGSGVVRSLGLGDVHLLPHERDLQSTGTGDVEKPAPPHSNQRGVACGFPSQPNISRTDGWRHPLPRRTSIQGN